MEYIGEEVKYSFEVAIAKLNKRIENLEKKEAILYQQNKRLKKMILEFLRTIPNLKENKK